MSMEPQPSAVVDEEAFAVRRTIRIDAPAEKVWTALTDPALISRWLGDTVLDGAGVGARGTVSWPDRGAIPLRIEAIDAPRSIAYRWSNDDASGDVPDEVDDATSTVFTFTLDPLPTGTRLTVVETGFEATSDPASNLDSHRRGWDSELDELVVLLGARA